LLTKKNCRFKNKIIGMPEMLANSTNPIVYLDIRIGKEEGEHEGFLY
jgi:hypothetical protein